MPTRRIAVRAPLIELRDDVQIITLKIGGRPFRLVGDGREEDYRAIACALRASAQVTLEMVEHPKFKMPDDVEG